MHPPDLKILACPKPETVQAACKRGGLLFFTVQDKGRIHRLAMKGDIYNDDLHGVIDGKPYGLKSFRIHLLAGENGGPLRWNRGEGQYSLFDGDYAQVLEIIERQTTDPHQCLGDMTIGPMPTLDIINPCIKRHHELDGSNGFPLFFRRGDVVRWARWFFPHKLEVQKDMGVERIICTGRLEIPVPGYNKELPASAFVGELKFIFYESSRVFSTAVISCYQNKLEVDPWPHLQDLNNEAFNCF